MKREMTYLITDVEPNGLSPFFVLTYAYMLLLREMSDKFIVSVLWWCIVRGDEEEQKVLINAALNLDDTTSYNSGLAVALK